MALATSPKMHPAYLADGLALPLQRHTELVRGDVAALVCSGQQGWGVELKAERRPEAGGIYGIYGAQENGRVPGAPASRCRKML